MSLTPDRPCAMCKRVIGKTKYCEHCKPIADQRDMFKKKAAERWRGNSGDRGYDREWQKVRRIKISSDPLCEMCERKGQIISAVLVHHIQPVDVIPLLRLDMSNLMSLCRHCHERLHGRSR